MNDKNKYHFNYYARETSKQNFYLRTQNLEDSMMTGGWGRERNIAPSQKRQHSNWNGIESYQMNVNKYTTQGGENHSFEVEKLNIDNYSNICIIDFILFDTCRWRWWNVRQIFFLSIERFCWCWTHQSPEFTINNSSNHSQKKRERVRERFERASKTKKQTKQQAKKNGIYLWCVCSL